MHLLVNLPVKGVIIFISVKQNFEMCAILLDNALGIPFFGTGLYTVSVLSSILWATTGSGSHRRGTTKSQSRANA